MKLLLSLLLLCVSSFGSAQILSINDSADPQSSYDPEDLIKNVMISSSCSTADTFTFQVYGAPEDLTTKSYGYFKTPPGSTFPFEEGVVLTTGSAFPAGNTVNTTDLITSSNGDSGDSDLEAALGQSNTQDATFIKFNFTPLVDAIDFRFIMASEEYDGNTECTYADSFAFLLREVGTSSYTNLAVLPDETPVSVRNINDAPDCRANTEYFEGYDVGNTNYGGRTKALTASSAVTPGVTYEIKLVVADQGDNAWDSAIFIEGGSFNIGGDLGVDRLIVDGNPGCIGTPITLDANLTISGVTFEWFKNGTVIAGETNSTLDVSTDGTYSFNVTLNDGCESTDEVIIEFTTPPEITTPPEDILLCETDGNGTEEFDFSSNEALVLGSQAAANFPISYHTSQANAEGNLNPLTIPYQNTLVTETIWMRIADTTQSCYRVVSFNIELRSQPIANTPSNFSLCDDSVDGDDTNGIVEFDLSTKVSEVLGSQLASDYDVKFYYDQAAASAGAVGTEITTPIQNTSNPQVIYVRIENKLNVDCFDTTSFQLIVNPLPEITTPPEDILLCETDGNGTEEFDFSSNEALVLGSQAAANFPISYHTSQANAEGNLNPLTIPYQNTLVTETIWMRIADTTQSCYRVVSFNIELRSQPIANTPSNFSLCDDSVDGDDTNGIVEFDLSTKVSEVLGSQLASDYDVKFYYDQAAASAGAVGTEITTPIQNTSNPQVIYVRIENKLNV
ncbi:MAG: choice-of-anchor L domain-containing protein, partial [Flavobacteriaceae bacterium]